MCKTSTLIKIYIYENILQLYVLNIILLLLFMLKNVLAVKIILFATKEKPLCVLRGSVESIDRIDPSDLSVRSSHSESSWGWFDSVGPESLTGAAV